MQHIHEKAKRTSTRAKKAAASLSQQSAARFFSTTELLEQVFLNVGNVKDLMPMRRVCHKWQDVIEGTRSLQKIMFLIPQQLDHEWHGVIPQSKVGNKGRALVLFKHPRGTPRVRRIKIVESARLNPLLFYKSSEHARVPIWHPWAYNALGSWTSQELYLRKDIRPKRTKINSTLLTMFATQPPVSEITLRTSDHSSRQICNAKGVKVIDVLRVAEQFTGWKAVVVKHVFFPPDEADVVVRKYYRDVFYAR